MRRYSDKSRLLKGTHILSIDMTYFLDCYRLYGACEQNLPCHFPRKGQQL